MITESDPKFLEDLAKLIQESHAKHTADQKVLWTGATSKLKLGSNAFLSAKVETGGAQPQPTQQAQQTKQTQPINAFEGLGTTTTLQKKPTLKLKPFPVFSHGIKNMTPEEMLENRIRFQLNILTPDNYETVKGEIKSIAEETKSATEKVADLLIEKAWTEVNYCKTYAKLCDFLGKNERLFFDEAKNKNYYKTYIVKKIQTVLDDESQMKMRSSKTIDEMSKDERESYYIKKKKRILGNVNFIGELLLVRFIPFKVVTYCTTTFFSKYFAELAELRHSTPDNADMKNHEDHLDSLIKLYEIVGKVYEVKSTKEDAKSKSNSIASQIEIACEKAEKGEADFVIDATFDMDELFNGLQVLLNKAPLTTRLRSLIQNLEYRRRNNWQAPEHANQGPKTLKAIHEEFEREAEESDKRAQDYYEGDHYNHQGRKKESNPSYVYQETKATHSAFASATTSSKSNELSKLQTELDDSKAEDSKKHTEQKWKMEGKTPLGVPADFFCPITQEIMKNPVIIADGHSYERTAIENWLRTGKNTSPLTGQQLEHDKIIQNITLKKVIEEFKEKIMPLISSKAL